MQRKCVLYFRNKFGETEAEAAGQLAELEGLQAKLLSEGYANGGVFRDTEETAGKPFGSRPDGFRLCTSLEMADVVLTSAGRAFSNLRDLAETLQVWADCHIRVVLADLPLDTHAPGGADPVKLVNALADVMSAVRGERNARGLYGRRIRGKPVSGSPPYGFKHVGPKGNRRYAPDHDQRRVGKLIVQWRTDGFALEAIQIALIRRGERRPNGREWSYGAIQRAFYEEVRLTALEKERGLGSAEAGG